MNERVGPRTGFCKVCAWPNVKALNRQLNAGMTAEAAVQWCKQRGMTTLNIKTIYKHKGHSKHPSDALVSYADRSLAGTVPAYSNQEVLAAMRDIGMANMAADPSTVSPGHALKAIELMERKNSTGQQLLDIIAKGMLGKPIKEMVIIEGSATEVHT